jgi:hypothetical protein
VKGATLSTIMLDMDMGADSIPLTADTHGHFQGSDILTMTGNWQIQVVLHSTDQHVHVATFPLTIQ